MATAIAKVTLVISLLGVDETIAPADVFHLARSKSTVYNIFSKKVANNELLRYASGVYGRVTSRSNRPGPDKIANKRVSQFDRTIARKNAPTENQFRHEFWTDGRSTSFRLLDEGQTIGTVALQERCRATSKKKKKNQSKVTRSHFPDVQKDAPGSQFVPSKPPDLPRGGDARALSRSKKEGSVHPNKVQRISLTQRFAQVLLKLAVLAEYTASLLLAQPNSAPLPTAKADGTTISRTIQEIPTRTVRTSPATRLWISMEYG